MQIHSHRFGDLEIQECEKIRFPQGMIGFPDEREFVLLRKSGRSVLGWLQSTTNPGLAFPVASLDALLITPQYYAALAAARAPTMDLPRFAEQFAAMVIVCASPDGPPTVNLLAPVVVDLDTRTGEQIFLPDSKCSTMEPFVLRERRQANKPGTEVQAVDAP